MIEFDASTIDRAHQHNTIIDTTRGIRFVTSTDPDDYEPVRRRIAEGMSTRFEGWDNEFDRQFDRYSRFFLLFNGQGELLAGCRLVHPRDPSQTIAD